MNINEVWDKMMEEKFSDFNLEEDAIRKAIFSESKSTSAVLKQRLLYKIYWVLFFMTAFAGWMLFSLSRPEVVIVFGIAFLIFGVGLVLLTEQYRKMKADIDFSESNLAVLKANLLRIKTALRYESLIAVPMYPLMMILGMLLSRIHAGTTIAEAILEPRFLWTMLICVLVLTPAVAWLGEKMNDSAYGSYIRQLEDNISKLEMIS